MGFLPSMYSLHYPIKLLALWRAHPGLIRYLNASWRIKISSLTPVPEINLTPRERFVRVFLYAWMGVQVSLAPLFLWRWWYLDLSWGWQAAIALLISYPLVLVCILPIARGIWKLGHPTMLMRSIISKILEHQVVVLRKRNSFKIVAVAGSVGKTSTKMAIARVLEESRRVQRQEGNTNARAEAPLFYSGRNAPESFFDIFAWIKIFANNARLLRQPYPYDFAILEIGTLHPGYIDEFRYLKPDLVVLTAVTPEHMEYFKTLDAVADEELRVLDFSEQALINIDDTPDRYLENKEYVSYGMQKKADYRIVNRKNMYIGNQRITLKLGKEKPFSMDISLLGEHGARIALAAASTAHLLGLSLEEIKQGMANIKAYEGRLQVFNGHMSSTILDDTFNATPAAVKAALDVLHSAKAPQRIAILGSMNELGSYSAEGHHEVGLHCDPSKLDLIMTIGKEAEKYLAPAAKERGCRVVSFPDPYSAGNFARSQLQKGAIILVKGSRNGIFAEEAIKSLLTDKTNEAKLVRQSPEWKRIKANCFSSLSPENP